MTDRDKPPTRAPGHEAPDSASDNVHRLDIRQAELGQDLRRLYAGLLEEDVPADLAALGAELEAKLAETGESGASDGGRAPRP